MDNLSQKIQDGVRFHAIGSRFGLNAIPRHIHNNVDSPYVFQPILTYIGEITSTGTATTLPNGWSVVRNSTGNYTITHNLNSNYYMVTANTVGTAGTYAALDSVNANDFTVATWVPSGTSYASVNTGFGFILVNANNRSQIIPSYL